MTLSPSRIVWLLTLLVVLPIQKSLAYWQQEVHYQIEATLVDEKARKFTGHETLRYVNHSPDTLRVVYFHLYLNAARRGSRMDQRRQEFFDYGLADSKPEQWGEERIDWLEDGIDRPLKVTVDETIARVELAGPLPPGAECAFEMQFTSIFPSVSIGRTGFVDGQFKGGYWYPTVAVYDHKMGWVNNQFLGAGEAYGEFGTFDVSLTFPAHFIVAATGLLQNRNEVLPESLCQKLRIENFKDKPWGSPASSVIPKEEGKNKTWRFRAENVHDFAFIADPTFRIGEAEWEGIKIYAYCQEKHASGWQDAAALGARAIQYFSETFGRYRYPQMIIGDSYDGMEFPMLVMCGGRSPSYRLVVYHEIGHNWYMGQVGSNQVDRAFLDEGFTTFMEINCIETFHGRKGNINFFDKWYEKKYYPQDEDRAARGYRPYYQWSKSGYAQRMIISADKAPENNVYRVSSYYKTVALLFNLQYVLGDSLFWQGMRTYFERWHFKHPYEDDFQTVMEEVSGRELDWFFDEWIHTTKTIDYAVARPKGKWVETDSGKVYRTQLRLSRKGESIMPLDLRVTLKNGQARDFLIPLDESAKPTFAQILPIWPQVREIRKKYAATVDLPAKPKRIEIDPSGRLADVNPLNNRYPIPKVELQLDNLKYNPQPVDAYLLTARPQIWFNSRDAVQLGLHVTGGYLGFTRQLSAEGVSATRRIKGHFAVKATHPFEALGRLAFWSVSARDYDGRRQFAFELSKQIRNRWGYPPVVEHRLISGFERAYDSRYLFDQSSWATTTVPYAAYLFSGHWPKRWGALRVQFQNESGAKGRFISDPAFNRTSGLVRIAWNVVPNWTLLFRLFGSHYIGARVPQKEFRLNGAEPEQVFDLPLLRSKGTIPNRWQKHFRVVGGGNLRGVENPPLGAENIIARTIEVLPPNLVSLSLLRKIPLAGNFLAGMRNYAFFDDGILMFDGAKDRYFYDLGVGFKFPNIWKNQKFQIDFPIFVGSDRRLEPVKFRWVVGWEVE